MRVRPIAVQFMAEGIVAMFELTLQNNEVKVVEEKHYLLVPAKDLSESAVRAYA